MVRALTVLESDGTILHLQMHDVIAHIIEVVVILIQREGLGHAAAEIDDRLQAGPLAAVCCAHAEVQRRRQHEDHQRKDQIFLPRAALWGSGVRFLAVQAHAA